MKTIRQILPVITALGLASAPWLDADSGVRTAVGSSGNWATPSQWQDSIIANGAGDTGDFGQATTASNSVRAVALNMDVVLGSLIWGDPTGVNFAYWSLEGNDTNTFTFNNLGSTATLYAGPGSSGSNNLTRFNGVKVLLADSLDIYAQTSATFQMTATTTIEASTAGVKTITNKGAGAGLVNLSGVSISDGAGTVAIVQDSATSRLSLGSGAANSFTGNVTITAGTLSVASDGRLGEGSLIMGGGTLAFANAAGTFSNTRDTTLNAGGGTFEMNPSVNATWGGVITGAGDLRKTLGGTLNLATANDYAGGSLITEGTLLVNNITGSGTGSGGVTVSGASARLGGTGIMAPNGGDVLVSQGVLMVGNYQDASGSGIVDLEIRRAGGTVNLTLTSSAELHLDLWSVGNYERLVLGSGAEALSSVSLGGATLVVSSVFGGFEAGQSYQIIDWGGVTPGGVFTISPFNLPALGDGLSWDVSNLYTSGTLTVVPEPSAGLLLILAAVACGARAVVATRKRKVFSGG